ncbi:MAG TPA: thymidylate synthase [Planctomycetota bacterium]|nr:thymidylate synthase [Planctomycetota bacterium]
MNTNGGNIPILFVSGRTLPEAWEKAILACWENGVDIRTEYDRKDAQGSFIDPPSRDCTMMVEVREPFGEPRIHKNFPGGPEELEVYRQEVVEGIHDHWIDATDPDKWTYTYHERIFDYAPTENINDPKAPRLRAINQIDYVVNKAAAAGHSRRIQAVTWMPTADPQTEDPPCLQRLWFRLLPNEAGEPVLNLNTSWRSRDAYKAWFMNVYALTDLQRIVAERISKKINRPVRVGRYMDQSDSFHIYGSYFKDVLPELTKMKDGRYEDRSWPSDHPAFQMLVEETREKLAKNRDYMRG